MATMKEDKKLTALEKAERSSIAWAEKGDPYSCLDFRILLLKNPKVKPPGFTDRDIAAIVCSPQRAKKNIRRTKTSRQISIGRRA